jgi:succinate dehydrogenase / fumarate reductase iron-sulfur subunit
LVLKALRLSNERKYETYIKASSQRQKAEGKIVEYPVDGIEEDVFRNVRCSKRRFNQQGDFQYLLTMIVAKKFAVLARCTSLTVRLTVQRTYCQLHMRMFKDGDTIFIEPLELKHFQ